MIWDFKHKGLQLLYVGDNAKGANHAHVNRIMARLERLDNAATLEELARRIGVSRTTISRLINERHRLTPDMAQRLGRCWGDGARVWLAHQQMVDEWELLHSDQSEYEYMEPHSMAA